MPGNKQPYQRDPNSPDWFEDPADEPNHTHSSIVNTALLLAVPLAGGVMTGALKLPYLGIGNSAGYIRIPDYMNVVMNGPAIGNLGTPNDDIVASVLDVGFTGGFTNQTTSATGSIPSGSSTLTLTAAPPSDATTGWTVRIPGAGTAGATLETTIASPPVGDVITITGTNLSGSNVVGATIAISHSPDPTYLWGADDFIYTGRTAGDIAGIGNLIARETEIHMYTPDAALGVVEALLLVSGIEAGGGGTVTNIRTAEIQLPYNFGSVTGTTASALHISQGDGGTTSVPGFATTWGLWVDNGLPSLLSGGAKLQAPSATANALYLQAYLSQSADIMAWWDITGTNKYGRISSGGALASASAVTAFEGLSEQVSIGYQSGKPGILFGTGTDAILVRTATGVLGTTAELQGSAISASGLTGATAASRYVGATTGGAPVSGTYAAGDWIVDNLGVIWTCTAAGSPGTWSPPVGYQVKFNQVTANMTALCTLASTWYSAALTSGAAPSITLPNDGLTYRVELVDSLVSNSTAGGTQVGIGTSTTSILAAINNVVGTTDNRIGGPVVAPSVVGSGQTISVYVGTLNAGSTVKVGGGSAGSGANTPCSLAAYRVA